MLGSLSEAEDAVQEAWINVSRAGAGGVDNLGSTVEVIADPGRLGRLELAVLDG